MPGAGRASGSPRGWGHAARAAPRDQPLLPRRGMGRAGGSPASYVGQTQLVIGFDSTSFISGEALRYHVKQSTDPELLLLFLYLLNRE